ncbi:MAG: Mitochondrial outer membrane protein iml2 [Bathelium mastoideum]|nr:MAG: Mitochondrial outer membrane protein iml2 [Bathelium mastoideum]
MNDDVDAAEAELSKGNSPFHKLGSAVVSFLRATLGFEQEMMREASERLADAENAAIEHQRRAQRDTKALRSEIYPPGTEFALCHAESQLMSAVVGVLNESLTESIKGFYKLRKAYVTLDGILQAEQKFMRGKSSPSLANMSAASSVPGTPHRTIEIPGKIDDTISRPTTPSNPSVPSSARSEAHSALSGSSHTTYRDEDEDEDADADDFVDAEEDIDSVHTPLEYQGKLDTSTLNRKMNGLALREHTIRSSDTVLLEEDLRSGIVTPTNHGSTSLADVQELGTIDDFIHAGSNLCFGLLLIMLSLIPPAFGKLLYVIGFKGDRERGIELLWHATRSTNINGALAGLMLLGFMNGMVSFCDIIPNENEEGGYPRQRCKALLASMRKRYPTSRLWLLEEARMLSGERQLEQAVEHTMAEQPSMLKQVEALRWFENSLNCMYLHRYAACSASFQKCITLNNWSHALYCYNAGASHLELYRQLQDSDPKLAREHAKKAEDLLKQAPKHTGKKRFMARQLPFDVFVYRKVAKWEQRAQEKNIPFVDAVGVSPLEEMCYFWNGYKRMRPEHLQRSLEAIAWSSDAARRGKWEKEALDERCIASLLRAAVLRQLGNIPEAKRVLQAEILCHDAAAFKGHLRDNWIQPVAYYEMAVCLWQERDGTEADRERFRECGVLLDKVANWETYDMEARVGMRVTTAKDTLRKYGNVARRPRTPSPSAPRGSSGDSLRDHANSEELAASQPQFSSPALTLWAASPTSESPTFGLPPLPTFPRRGRIPETPSAPSSDPDRFHIASWGSPYSGPTPESRASSGRRHRRSLSGDTFDGDSPDHRFDLGHLLPSRVPELDLFEGGERPNSRVASSERNTTPRPSFGARPATSPSLRSSRTEDNELEEYLQSRFSGEGSGRWSDISLSSEVESADPAERDSIRITPLSRRKDILRTLFNSSPTPEEGHRQPGSAEGNFRRHRPRGSNQTVTQHDFWGTSTDFLSQARGKMMESKYASRMSEPARRPEPSSRQSNSWGYRAPRGSEASSNPLLESKYATVPPPEDQKEDRDDNDHASGYKFTEVGDTMEQHARQLEPLQDRRSDEPDLNNENDGSVSSTVVGKNDVQLTDTDDAVVPTEAEKLPQDSTSIAKASETDVHELSKDDPVESVDAEERTQNEQGPPTLRVVTDATNVQEQQSISEQEVGGTPNVPLAPSPSPRATIRVPFGKRMLTIRFPNDELRGKEGGPPRPLNPEEVAARIAHFEEQGYDTRGFLSGDNDNEFGLRRDPTQNRPIFPDTETIRSDAEQIGRVVRIPDPKAWKAYVDFLTEQKLRALGVTIGDEEPSAPPPALSRQSSTAQYPNLPFSPQTLTSPAGVQQMPQPPNAFSAASGPESVSSNRSRKASIASPLPGFMPSNPRAQLQRQGSFPFGVQSQQGNVSPFSAFSPQQQFASPLAGPRTASPATQHPFAARNSPGPAIPDMQQLMRYPPAIQAELMAQMQRQQQQQLQARLQQQQQLALNTKLPDFADDDLEEEPVSAHVPLQTRMIDRDQQEIAVPRPRSHRHNLSATLEKDIPNAEYHLEKQGKRQADHDSASDMQASAVVAQEQRPSGSRMASETRWNDAVQSLQVLSHPRPSHRDEGGTEQGFTHDEDKEKADDSAQELDNRQEATVLSTDTNRDLDGEQPRSTQISQAPTRHVSKPSISGLNVGAKEFKFNPNVSFQPGNFSFSGANFQHQQSKKQPQPNYSRPLPRSPPEKPSFNISAPAFNPTRAFGNAPSSQGFNFSAPSFKPGAPEFKPSAPAEDSTSGGEQPVANRIFSSIPSADPAAEVVRQPRKSKAVQIINPNLLPKPAKPEELEDEEGRLIRDDDRLKRARRTDDDGDQVPQFAFPIPPDPDMDASALPQVPVVPSNDGDEKFEEVSLGEESIPTPAAATGVQEIPGPTPSKTSPSIDELRQRALDSINRPQEQVDAAIDPNLMTEDRSKMSPAQAALHAVMYGRRHGHKSSLSATAKPFEFKRLSSDNDFPSFSGKTSEIIDSQNDSSQILSSPTQPLESSIATTFRPSDSFLDQAVPQPRKESESESAPYPVPDNAANQGDFEQPSLAEIDVIMRQLNETDDFGGENAEAPSWQPSSPPFHAEQPLLKPWSNMRSDAPSPSPNRPHPTIEADNFEDETESHDPFSDSHAAGVEQSPIHRLNNERDVPISDWDDAFSSADEKKLKAQVQSRSIFFEPHVEKVVAKALQTKMDPMMTTLLQLQDSISSLNVKNAVERRSLSASAGAESDADDEDDDEDQRPPRSRSRTKAFPTPELLNPEKIKSAMIEALQVYNTPPTPPAAGVVEFHEALVSLKAAVARSDAEKMQLEDIKAIMEETLNRRDTALVHQPRGHVPYPEDDGQVMQLERMLQDATVRAAEAVNHRNEIEDRATESKKLLRLAEEELSLYKELDHDKEHTLRSARDELSDLKEHLKDVQEHRVAAEKEHKNLTAKISSLEEEHAAMESTLEEYRESKRVWRLEIDDLTKERETLRSSVAALKTQVSEGLEKREDMRDRLSRLQEDMANSAEQMASAKAHWHQQDLAHQTRAELLTVRIGDEARTRERLEREIERLEIQEKEHMKLRVLVDHTQRENTRLEDMVTMVKKELFEQQQLAVRFEREFNDSRDAARVEIQRTRTLLEADLEAANHQVNLVRADLEAENVRIRAELEAENARLRSELDNSKMEADTAREKDALLLEEAADSKRDALQEAVDSKRNALQDAEHSKHVALQEAQESRAKAIHDLHQSYEHRIAELRADHTRTIGNAHEDRERVEKLFNERLGLSDAKLEHYQDKVVHLEQKLEVAQSAAQAAVKAAQSAKANPQVAQLASAAAHAAAVPTSKAPVPEKISPQALRESIMVLQEQLQERESRIEQLESELRATDTEAPAKLKERDTEISWLRELLGVRIDDLSDLINSLSQPAYDPETVRDAAIRIRANLQMEQQEKERLIAAKIAPGQAVPVSVTGQQALASLSNFASPKAAQLAAAFGNWRKGSTAGVRASNLSSSTTNNRGRATPTPLRRPTSSASASTVAGAGSTTGWISGLMTPPTSSLRKTPSPAATVSPEKPHTPRRHPLSGSGSGRSSTRTSPRTLRRPLLQQQYQQQQHLTARQLAKQPAFGGEDAYGVGLVGQQQLAPATPPLLRKASYDEDAEDGAYSTAGFEGFEDEEGGAMEEGDEEHGMMMTGGGGERGSPEPPRLKLDFGAAIGGEEEEEEEEL